ncbi:putative rho guanine nucleotide exchange factor 2, partial [Triplophysa rosa]
GPEEPLDFMMSSISPPPCSPPNSPGPLGVTLRSPSTRHLIELDPWRRHSWEPGAVAQGYSPNDTRSVSLEDLDPDEMALVLNGALRSKRAREDRRSITQVSLTSLTEEDVVTEHQEHHRSPLEEQSNQMHGCSASAPSLNIIRPMRSAPRPRSYCHDSVSYHQVGGSSQSIDSEPSSLSWETNRGQVKAEGDENKGDTSGNRLERTISFLRRMTAQRKFCFVLEPGFMLHLMMNHWRCQTLTHCCKLSNKPKQLHKVPQSVMFSKY